MRNALELQKETGNRIHFLHISTAGAIKLLKGAKGAGSGVSFEATPHHLFLTEEETKKQGNFAKMNPPLRSEEDRKAVWGALASGSTDLVGTDHAPHTREEKEKGFWEAPSGVPGIETMLPLLLNEASAGRLELARVVQLCCEAPAGVFGIEGKGAIAEGMDADLVAVDMERELEIKNGSLFTKCGWSPFAGRKLKGVVEKTIVNGQLVYDNGKFNEETRGREVRFHG